MHSPNVETLSLIKYRMQSVAIGLLALKHSLLWDRAPSIEIFFDGKKVIEGKATAFTNSAIEAGVVHARALLEFLGLNGASQTKLREHKTPRKKDDTGIEQFGKLVKVSIADAVSPYPGPPNEAEAALAYVIYLANKGLAHTTSSFTRHDRGSALLDIAFRGVPVLMINRFYIPLQIQPPEYELQWRTRDSS